MARKGQALCFQHCDEPHWPCERRQGSLRAAAIWELTENIGIPTELRLAGWLGGQ